MKIKVSELSKVALDWAVAQVENPEGFVLRDATHEIGCWVIGIAHDATDPESWLKSSYHPSIDWSIGGPLIESNQVFLDPPHDMHRANYDEKTGKVKGCWETYESWHATVSARVRTLPPKIEGFPGRVGRGEGETALIAACRAIVASVFGDEVEIPQELAP